MSDAVSVCAMLVAWIALVRVVFVILGLIRQAVRTRKTLTTQWGWVELFMAPEPFLMGIVVYLIYFGAPSDVSAATTPLPMALLGVILGGIATLVTVWAMVTIPSLSVGHYVLDGQGVVDRGPYALIRHPMYSAVLLIWFALAATFSSLFTLLVTVLYVIPAYWFYARSEEGMMLSHFGERYRTYQRRTGMFFPRLRGPRA